MSMKKLIFFLATMSLLAIGTPAHAQHCDAQKGDSMWRIAKRYHIPFAKILILNKHYPNQNLIHPKDDVQLPEGEHGQSTEQDNTQEGTETAEQSAVTEQAREVLKLVNSERAKAGLQPLVISSKLTDIANTKAKDMADKGYFDHTSPTYGSPFDMLQHFGVKYTAAGENIAAGQKDAAEVMNSWMNSSGHRANILNANYEQIGIGYVTGGKWGTYWVQLFIK
jgi:uncharacterized YkwD family protein